MYWQFLHNIIFFSNFSLLFKVQPLLAQQTVSRVRLVLEATSVLKEQ